MNYVELDCKIEKPDEFSEIVIAHLAELGFESFEETPSGIKAYIKVSNFDEEMLNELNFPGHQLYKVEWTKKIIPHYNWNTVWESNFSPVTIKDQVYIRAEYHAKNSSYKYEIVIHPKMSFGTGHHSTTELMIETMLDLDFKNKTVLDMGCGTGILAIMAEKLGAKHIVAIDHDQVCLENGLENVERNRCSHINVLKGDVALIPKIKFDTVLANINRNIILDDVEKYAQTMHTKAVAIFSGFYEVDLRSITAEAFKHKLHLKNHHVKNNWCVAVFEKE